MRRLTLLALIAASIPLVGCGAGDAGGGVIKPDTTKSPMAERADKSGDANKTAAASPTNK